MALASAIAEGDTEVVFIGLEPMPQQAETLFPDDDWTGLSSPVERRKRQNRMNQRSYSEYFTTPAVPFTGFTRNCH